MSVQDFDKDGLYIKNWDETSDATYNYLGLAPWGTADDEPRWRIRRIAKDIQTAPDGHIERHSGPPSVFNVKWTERLTVEYK